MRITFSCAAAEMNSLITHSKNYSKVNEMQMKNITQDKIRYVKTKTRQETSYCGLTNTNKVPGEKFVCNSESELTSTVSMRAAVSYNFHSQSVNENKITDWQQMCYETHRNMTFTPLT